MIRFLKPKKYLKRILISVTLLAVVLVSISFAAVHYNSERTVLRIQREANEQILAQINYNMRNLDELVNTLAFSLYWDPELIPLMTNTAKEDIMILDLLRKLRRLDTVVNTNTFLDSILVFNSNTGDIFSGGNPEFRNRDNSKTQVFLDILQEGRFNRKQFLPIQFDLGKTQVDMFSYVMNEMDYSPYGNESAVILNVKPDWLFQNLSLINKLALKNESQIFLVNNKGVILSSRDQKPGIIEEMNEPLSAKLSGLQDSGYFDLTMNEEKHLISYAKTNINELYVVTVQPHSALLGDIYKLRTTSFWMAGFFLLLSLVIAVWIGRKLYEPIESLTNLVRDHSIQSADSNAFINDELSYISNSYKHLRDNLIGFRREQVDKNKLLETYYVRKMITDSTGMTIDEVDELTSHNEFPLVDKGNYLLVVLSIDDYGKFRMKTPEQELKLYKFAILNIAKEVMAKSYPCVTVDMRSNNLVVLMNLGDGTGTSNEIYAEMLASMKVIQEVILQFYKITVGAAISQLFTSYKEITAHYELTQQYASYHRVYGKMSIISPDMVESNMKNTDYQVPIELEERLSESLKAGSLVQYEETVDRLVEHISRLNVDFHMYCISHMIVVLRYTLNEMNNNRVQPIYVDLNMVNQKVIELSFIEDIRPIFIQVFEDVMTSHKQVKEDRNDILMETIKEYIHANYMDSTLNLQGISAMMKMSSDYVGRMFKKYEQMSVAEYTNEIRLFHTQRLLEDRNYTINQIMEEVGYSSQSSFFVNFKKKFGVTPREYRLKKSIK
jgi:AraC-like DNA-binding protein